MTVPPWEEYRSQAPADGPWNDYQPRTRPARSGRNDPTGERYMRESNEALRRAGARPPANPYVGAQVDNNPTPAAERLLRFVREAPRRAGAPDGRTSPERARERYGQNPTVRNPVTGRTEATRGIPTQMVSNLGLGDELMGGGAYLRQGAENLVRRATGQPIEITGADAYHAGAQQDRDEARRYAEQRPVSNALSYGLGFATSAPARAAAPVVGNAVTQTINAGRNALIGTAPYAFAAAQGNPVERIPQTLEGMAAGAGLGMGLNRAGAFLAQRAQAVRARPPTPQRVLANEGVSMTPGQMMGGAARRLEDGMTSIPVAGDAIRSAQRRGIDTFGRAAINRVLRPLGARLPNNVNAGRDGLAHAETTVSDAYNSALNPVTVRPDSRMGALIARARMGTTHPQMQQDLDAILADTIGARFRGNITGQEWKRLDEEIGAAIRAATAGMGTNPAQRQLRTALVQVQRGLRGAMQRQNPNAYARVRQADAATANLVRVRRASQTTGTAANGGQFTPAQLNNAVQATDNSAGNRDYARGDALLQDLTDPAMQVLPPSVPDSGTPIRSILSAAGLGGGAAATGVIPPSTALGAGAAVTGIAAAYSPPVIWAINALYRAGGRVPPGQAEAALAVLAREAAQNPSLVPLYEHARAQARPADVPEPNLPALAEPTYQ